LLGQVQNLCLHGQIERADRFVADDEAGTDHERTSDRDALGLATGELCGDRLMVRETGSWGWSELFRRCSFLPAKLLADVAPSMRGKGLLASGFDADLIVVDPERFTDAATFQEPTRPSVGVIHSVVSGRPVVSDGAIVHTSFPGRPVIGQPS
jgi:dihydroorotase-like cyclic amidohydrolase